MKCSEIIEQLEKLSPVQYACEWDHVGLMVGERTKEIYRILVTLDVDDAAVEQAIAQKADMIVSHHPLIFGGIQSVTMETLTGRRILKLIQNGIVCYSMHTNFDIVGGMAQLAADALGFENARPLEITSADGEGLGRIADVKQTATVADWAERTKKAFHLPNVKVFGDLSWKVQKAAVYPGSGKDGIDCAIAEQADLIITGDIGHHAGIDAAAWHVAVIDAGHYGIEHIFIAFMADYLRKNFERVEVCQMPIVQPFVVI